MTRQVTLDISDTVYRQAQLLAEATNRPLQDVLAESIVLPDQQMTASRLEADPAIAQETAAFLEMHSQLLETFAGQYVAIYQGELVDNAPDFATLFTRVARRYLGEFVLIRQVTTEPEPIYRFRSPRFTEAI